MSPSHATGPAILLMLWAAAPPLIAQNPGDLSPLTAADQARVEALLQGFDPNSFELRTHVMNPDGSVQSRTVGADKGLASLQQLETERSGVQQAAPYTVRPGRTNTNINIFSQAKTNTNINIFREAARTNTNINIFRDERQQQAANEINAILQRYLTTP